MKAAAVSPASRRQRWLLYAALGWAGLWLILAPLDEPIPEDLALSTSIALSGLYTVLLYLTRGWWLPRLSARPLRNAMALGIFNAAVIETLFLVVERIYGAEGIAASPNLLLDLLITMPWYVGMVVIFVRVQHRRRFNGVTVLFLGGLYEVAADGLVGGVLMEALGGNFIFLDPGYWALLLVIAVWQFILVYSSMVLPPAWVIATTPPPDDAPSGPAWRDALRPMLWAIPFAVYLVVLMVVLALLGGA